MTTPSRLGAMQRALLIGLLFLVAGFGGYAAWQRVEGATAYNDAGDACASGSSDLVSAVQTAIGHTPHRHLCDYTVFGSYPGDPSLQSKVNDVLDNCGASDKYLVAAIITAIGENPIRGSGAAHESSACSHSIYDTAVQRRFGAGSSIDWNTYDESGNITGANQSVVYGVNNALLTCGDQRLTMAFVQVTGVLPWTPQDSNGNFKDINGAAFSTHGAPAGEMTFGAAQGSQSNGQCNRSLYNHGAFYNYQAALDAVFTRTSSTATCPSNPNIAQAFHYLTSGTLNQGLNPLPGECDIYRYRQANLQNFWDEEDPSLHRNLVTAVQGSLYCINPWIGEAVTVEMNRDHPPRGAGDTGECTRALYPSGSICQDNYQNANYAATANGVIAMLNAIDAAGLEFTGTNGDVRSKQGNLYYPGGGVAISDPTGGCPQAPAAPHTGVATTAAGQTIIDRNGYLQPAPGANLANVVSVGAGNVVSVGAGNVVSVGAGNILSNGSSGVVSVGAGNVVSVGAGN